MRKILIGITFLSIMVLSVHCKKNLNDFSVNRLIKCTTTGATFSEQIMFEFVRPFYFEKRNLIKGEQVDLIFPGMKLNDFKKHAVVEKINNVVLVSKVIVFYEEKPVPRVIVRIKFRKNEALLRFAKTEDPNLLVVDVFNKAALNELNKKSSTTLYACNDSVKSDSFFFMGDELKKKSNCCVKKKWNIVIDAGHGGRDVGGHALGIKEKDLTLDIARKVRAELKRKGHTVFLTRNKDITVSLVDRFQFAHQLHADLFISVHVNSFVGGAYVSGIETHYLDENSYFDKKGCSNYVFADGKHDRELVAVADTILKNKVDSSKLLSESLQNNLIDTLRKRKIDISDRGIKRAGFRTLLRSESPAAIVEVGFLTNKKEAKRLNKDWYRKLLAQSISNGISEYIKMKI